MARIVSADEKITAPIVIEEDGVQWTVTFSYGESGKGIQGAEVDAKGRIPLGVLRLAIDRFVEMHPEFEA
jgi:hypothetical protein